MANEKKTLLAVLAHPDDETFGMGGTLAYYAGEGVEVNLICATRGEAGEVPAPLLANGKTIGALREEELRCAARELGISRLFLLDYRDSGMKGSPDNEHPDALMNAPVEDVALKIVRIIRRTRPQVVLTFDPIGGYYHPDHIAVHRAALLAFERCADPAFGEDTPPFRPDKLYFHLIPKRFLRWMVRFLKITGRDPHHWGKNGDIDLASLLEVNFPVHARIDYTAAASRKEAAAQCHVSQGGGKQSNGLMQRFTRFLDRKYRYTDSFMCAFPAPDSGSDEIETDLFAGIS